VVELIHMDLRKEKCYHSASRPYIIFNSLRSERNIMAGSMYVYRGLLHPCASEVAMEKVINLEMKFHTRHASKIEVSTRSPVRNDFLNWWYVPRPLDDNITLLGRISEH